MAWLTGWKYRKKITVQDANVIADLTNFPVYVFINADTDFHQARADGHDIRFTLSDGKTLLKYEREHWTGGNGSPATAHFWVKVPSILASGGATIYIYYGKSDAPDGANAPNVWDANFKGVWHMKDLTPSTIADSTGLNADGTKVAANEPIEANGKVYKGQDFGGGVGSGDYVSIPSYVIDLTKATISFWAKRNVLAVTQDGTNTFGALAVVGRGSSLQFLDMRVDDTYFEILGERDVNNESWAAIKSNVVADTELHHFIITCDNNVFTLLIDGVEVGIDDDSAAGWTSNTCTINAIGKGYPTPHWFYSSFWDGLIDEIRFSNVARAIAWLKFEYHNINEADNELTWGIEDAFPSKFFGSKRADFAGVRKTRPFGIREMSSAHVKTTRPATKRPARGGYKKWL